MPNRSADLGPVQSLPWRPTVDTSLLPRSVLAKDHGDKPVRWPLVATDNGAKPVAVACPVGGNAHPADGEDHERYALYCMGRNSDGRWS